MNRLGTVLYLAFLWVILAALVVGAFKAATHLTELILP